MVKSRLNKHKLKNHWDTKKLLLIVMALLVIAGFGWLVYARSRPEGPDIQEVKKVVREIESYPEAYKKAGLPKYPGAEVTNFSSQSDTPAQVISLIIATKDSVAAAADYFDHHLKGAGWQAVDSSSKLSSKSLYYRSYLKGEQQFDIIAQRSENHAETTVTIDWHLKKQ